MDWESYCLIAIIALSDITLRVSGALSHCCPLSFDCIRPAATIAALATGKLRKFLYESFPRSLEKSNYGVHSFQFDSKFFLNPTNHFKKFQSYM